MSTTLISPSTARRRAHSQLPERVDVAIIGSGLGGLIAAARLAQEGLSVAVFEGHYVAGGCATHFVRGSRDARYRFDVGLHYIGDCGPNGQIPRVLREVGVDDVRYRPLDPDGFDRLVFPDFEFQIPANLGLYRDRLVALFPHERRAIDKYVTLVRAVTTAMRAMAGNGRPALAELLPLAMSGLRLASHRNATIGQVLDTIGARDPKLRAVLLGQSGDYGLPPSKASALLHLGLSGHYFLGAYYPEGGGQIIADKLSARIESLGGSIHLRHPVERILVQQGRAVGVRLAARAGEPSRHVRADVVLSNADYQKTLLELVGVEHLPGALVERTKHSEMAVALFLTCLGIEGQLEGMGPRNVWQFDSYDMEGFFHDDPQGPVQTHGCYVTSATYKDPDHALHHAPAGISNVEVMTLVPGAPERYGLAASEIASGKYADAAGYQAIKKRLEDDMIARLDGLFPGAASRVVFRESASPITHTRFTQASGGTGYGLAGTPEQFLAKRPDYRGPLPGLYLCGASTRGGHGIVGVLSGGRAAAKAILHDRKSTVTSPHGVLQPA